MRSCRGPSFADPPSADGHFAPLDSTRFSSRSTAPLPASRVSQQHSTIENTGFQPLAADQKEPTAEELSALVDDFFSAIAVAQATEAAAVTSSSSGGVSNSSTNTVVFQGNGDPLEAASVVVDTVNLVAARRDDVCFRLNTLGLCDDATVDLLLSSSGLSGRGCTRISHVSIFLPASQPQKYAELLQPCEGRGFDNACSFIRRCAAHGADVDVEVTAVDRPDVDVAAIEELARGLGATSFRTRSWVG